MRILSLNVWGGRLLDALIPFLIEADADVLCLQEVVRSPGARSGWLVYRGDGGELPQRARLYDELCSALPDHDAGFFPAGAGYLFDGDEAIPSEIGLATFTRRTLPVIGHALDFVHGAYTPGDWGRHPRPRNAHCVRLFDPAHRATVVVAQMHGLRDPAGKDDTPERRDQARAFARLIERIRAPGERLVACGDFNVLPGSATFDVLAGLGLSDLVTGHGFTDTRTSFYARQNRFADYMLATPEITVGRFDVVAGPEVSDHRALLLDIGAA